MASIKDILTGSDSKHVYVIAEIGSNHAARLERAIEYIDACADAGADAVKFQSWTTADIQNSLDPDTHQPSPVYDILERYELPVEWHAKLKSRCDERGVDFLSTPFDINKARLLKELNVPAIKIASGDLTYTQLLNEVAEYGIPVLLSTGMATPDEIAQALTDLGDAATRTVLLHCVGAYPPAFEDANVRAVQTLSETFNRPVGISDHYPGYATIIAAIALGARVVEKHVTFSRNEDNPDSPFALEINEFAEMIRQIRIMESALGDGVKQCRESEAGGKSGGRRSLYWRVSLNPGDVVREEHIAVVRPNAGDYQPRDLDALVGKALAVDVCAGHAVCRTDFAMDKN